MSAGEDAVQVIGQGAMAKRKKPHCRNFPREEASGPG